MDQAVTAKVINFSTNLPNPLRVKDLMLEVYKKNVKLTHRVTQKTFTAEATEVGTILERRIKH